MITAALLGLAATGLTAQLVSAAPPWQGPYGMHCGGIQAERCAWLEWDLQGRRIRAAGNTLDKIGGGNYSVALNDVKIQILVPFGGWTSIGGTAVGDYDGWHATSDSATSNPAGYWCGWQYRALTLHRWTGDSAGGEWIASNPATFC